MLLLDTNVVSEIRRVSAGRADPNVERWARGIDPSTAFISVITVHELEHGVRLVERRDEKAGAVLRAWLDNDLTETFAGRTLPVDVAVARRAAALHVPDPAPINDAYIAATALEHRLAIATRNVADFTRFDGLEVVDPWIA